MNGLPGEIQFVDLLNNKKIANFKAIRRHHTLDVGEINPDPLEVTNVEMFYFKSI